MAFSRFSKDCDVYVYEPCTDVFQLHCQWCVILKGETFAAHSIEEMTIHLKQHRKNGDKVPKWLEYSIMGTYREKLTFSNLLKYYVLLCLKKIYSFIMLVIPTGYRQQRQ